MQHQNDDALPFGKGVKQYATTQLNLEKVCRLQAYQEAKKQAATPSQTTAFLRKLRRMLCGGQLAEEKPIETDTERPDEESDGSEDGD